MTTLSQSTNKWKISTAVLASILLATISAFFGSQKVTPRLEDITSGTDSKIISSFDTDPANEERFNQLEPILFAELSQDENFSNTRFRFPMQDREEGFFQIGEYIATDPHNPNLHYFTSVTHVLQDLWAEGNNDLFWNKIYSYDTESGIFAELHENSAQGASLEIIGTTEKGLILHETPRFGMVRAAPCYPFSKWQNALHLPFDSAKPLQEYITPQSKIQEIEECLADPNN